MIRILVILFAFVSTALAQDQLTATVDRNSVRVGETFQLTFTFNGGVSGVSAPSMPNLEKLKIVGGPSTGTNVQITPGRAISTISWTYAVRATEQGKGTVGPTSVKFKGREYSSSPISVTVLAANAPDAQGGGKQAGNDVFIRVTSDRTMAFQGEQILLTYKIYFAVQITNPEISKMPRTTGFWVEEIPLPDRLELIDEVINGRAYKAAVFRKLALFPTGAGDLEIEPLQIRTNAEVRARGRVRDPFDIFSFGPQMQPIEVESPKVNLRINPLPTSNAPAGFSGVVGTYTMKASFDRPNCATHEAVTLSVKIEGYGNIATLTEPTIQFPPDFEHYDPKLTDNIRRERGKVSGSKTFEYVVIPRAPGTQRIPSISYSYFDPEKSRYVTLQSGDLELQVQKGNESGQGSAGIPVAGKRGVESVATDIAYAKTQPGSFVPVFSQPHRGFSFWIFTSGPWVILAGFAIVTRRQMKLESGSTRYRFKKSLATTMKALAKAEKANSGGRTAEACGLIATAIESSLAVKFDIDSGTLTFSRLEELWVQNGLDSDLFRRIQRLLSDCDISRFGISTLDRQTVGKLISEAKQVLSLLEKINVAKMAA